jgi:hypothetical protein
LIFHQAKYRFSLVINNQQAYPISNVTDLYHQRWGAEEDYKELKTRLNIENYSNLSVEGALQDLHAKYLTKILASATDFEAKMALTFSEKNKAL